MTRIASGSIAVAAAVLALKAAAWWVTGSAALYSDALESVVNVLGSAAALAALRFALQPADHNHPYGHAKAEFFAAAFEGALIAAAAVSILQTAWTTWRHPEPLAFPLLGIALNAVATLANLLWARRLFRAAASPRSPALLGDASHLMSDVATSTGIVAGFALAVETGHVWLDPAIAAATAIYVLWSGLRLIAHALGGLMDMAPEDDTLPRIRAVLRRAGAGAIEAHDIRARQAGRVTFVQFHLVVPGEMPVLEAHEICDRIEGALRAEMADLIVNIHVEPEHKAKPADALALR